MWRLKLLIAAVVAVTALVLGVAVAYGYWYWNAQIDVEGVDVRTVWTVTGDPDGQDNYSAKIVLNVPKDAEAQVIKAAANERVKIKHTGKLICTDEGVEA